MFITYSLSNSAKPKVPQQQEFLSIWFTGVFWPVPRTVPGTQKVLKKYCLNDWMYMLAKCKKCN